MDCPIKEKCKVTEKTRNVLTCNKCMIDKINKIKKLTEMYLTSQNLYKKSQMLYEGVDPSRWFSEYSWYNDPYYNKKSNKSRKR